MGDIPKSLSEAFWEAQRGGELVAEGPPVHCRAPSQQQQQQPPRPHVTDSSWAHSYSARPGEKAVMEIGVRLIGLLQLLLRLMLRPLQYLRSLRPAPRLPPIQSRLLFHSASHLAKLIRTQQVSSEEVVRAYVERIRAVNPFLNALVEGRFEAAVEEARDADRLVAQRGAAGDLHKLPPLHGVPFTVKESCTLKGMSCCVGSVPRKGMKADKDGQVVALMKKAGAIPLAVTATPELCLSWETNNLITGKTCNPYDLLRTSGGSSGGEAALLGAGASVIGVASDIAGSIRIPAMYNGIFGHKPTPGYISIEGHYPSATSDEFKHYLTVGPLTRYSEDLKPVLKVMAGEKASGLRLDEEVNMKDLRVIYMEEAGFSFVILHLDNEIRKVLQKAVNFLHKKFDIPVQKGNIEEMSDSVEMSAAVFFGMPGIPNLLQKEDNPKESHNLFVEILKSIFGISKYSPAALAFYLLKEMNVLIPRYKYNDYCAQRNALRKKFVDILGDSGVFIYPTHPTAAIYHNDSYIKTAGVLYTMVFNVLGMPATHVPLGLNSEGLPIGIQVVAAPHQDRLCIAVAQELSKEFGGWVPPPESSC
ncbi:fatty-acid amide hydrolase 2-like [Schistocerca piceifrons]|uniref:fatty-acid amide hydrolase 2-like n=1 Tax=Schistocerca piceifrons TaxID=274613 RepID=UPI001F5E9750|nr:fatty-acid amide hydrolase 2-like [Schistocerca piceifrons]